MPHTPDPQPYPMHSTLVGGPQPPLTARGRCPPQDHGPHLGVRVPGMCAAHCGAVRSGHLEAAAQGGEVAAAAAAAAGNHPATCSWRFHPVRHSPDSTTTSGVPHDCYQRQCAPATTTTKWEPKRCTLAVEGLHPARYANKAWCGTTVGRVHKQHCSAVKRGRQLGIALQRQPAVCSRHHSGLQ